MFALSMLCGAELTAQTMNVAMRDGQTHQFATADIEEVSFEMPGAGQGQFEIRVSEITAVSAKLSVYPDDNSVRYYFDVSVAAEYERSSAKEIVEGYFVAIQKQYPGIPLSTFLDGALSCGPDEDTVSGLPANTDMVCYAIAVDDTGHCLGEPAVVPFHTLAGGDPANCTFEITYSGVSSTEVTVNVKPSDPTVRYWMGLYSAVNWPGDLTMTQMVKSSIDEYVASSSKSLEDVVKGVTFTDKISSVESGLDPTTPYYIYVYAMDYEGNPAARLYKERFTTTANDYSDASLSLRYRYFDGNELAEAYPDKFANAAGKVLIQAVFTPNETAANYVWAVASGDLSDEQLYPEDVTKQAMLQAGFINVPAKNIYAQYGDATFLYYAADAFGIDGYLKRTLANITPDEASPASTYEDIMDNRPEMPALKTLCLRNYGVTTDATRLRTRLSKCPTHFRLHF